MFDKHQPQNRQHDDGPELPAELTALERQLARLSPAAPRLDRDRLMFDAGRAAVVCATGSASALRDARSMRRSEETLAKPVAHSSRFWPCATATMTAASLLLSAMLVWQSRQLQQTPPDVQKSPTFVGTTAAVAVEPMVVEPIRLPLTEPLLVTRDSGYLTVRRVLLTRGVSALDQEGDFSTGGTGLLNVPRPPATAGNLLRELLPEAAPVGGSRI